MHSWVKKARGSCNKYKKLIQTQTVAWWLPEGKGVGEGEEGMGVQMVMGGDLTWGGEHIIQYTDDVLYNCTPETYVILLTNVTPINSIKKEK